MLSSNAPKGLFMTLIWLGRFCAGMGLVKFGYRAVNRVLIADARQTWFVLWRGRGLGQA